MKANRPPRIGSAKYQSDHDRKSRRCPRKSMRDERPWVEPPSMPLKKAISIKRTSEVRNLLQRPKKVRRSRARESARKAAVPPGLRIETESESAAATTLTTAWGCADSRFRGHEATMPAP